MSEEILKRLDELEARVSRVESKIIAEKKNSPVVESGSKSYDGLIGGINLLLDDGYFKSLRSSSEVHKELSSKNYYYSLSSVDKALRVDFLTKKRQLARVKENGKWKYAIRK